MGVIYKLKPEIRDFLLERKKNEPALSCRKLAALIQDKFNLELSKSTINAIIKEAGLSLPVGRRKEKRKYTRKISLPAQIEFKPAPPPPIIEPPPTPLEPIPLPPPPPPVKEPEPVKEPPSPVEVSPVKSLPEAPKEKIEEVKIAAKVEFPSEITCTGAILLKAADYLLGGSSRIQEAARNLLNRREDDLAKIETLIYQTLFNLNSPESSNAKFPLWALINQQITPETLNSYLIELQKVKALSADLSRVISGLCREIHFVKVVLSDNTEIYLDGQLHTIWSTPHIPYDFSTTHSNIKSYMNRYSQEESVFVFFMAPGADIPSLEFFHFMQSLEPEGKGISKLALYGNNFKETEVLSVISAQRRFLLFGLWPWQFEACRKINKLGEFKPFFFAALKQNFYLAEAEVSLLQPTANIRVTLRGCALKRDLNEKARLLILGNFPLQKITPEEAARLYLERWPNLEEALEDLNRKVELSDYTAGAQRSFSTEGPKLLLTPPPDLKALCEKYLGILDLFVKWHFLPVGHENMPFATIKEHFYDLKTVLEEEEGLFRVIFKPPTGYRFLPDLAYACQRLNEREIFFSKGRRLWFRV